MLLLQATPAKSGRERPRTAQGRSTKIGLEHTGVQRTSTGLMASLLAVVLLPCLSCSLALGELACFVA